MRITGGRCGGRRLDAPKGINTRPTSDSHREALFNIVDNGLGHSYPHVLDLFSGSGALLAEALSREANFAVAFEKDREAAKCIQKNIEALRNEIDFEFIQLHEAKIERWPEALAKILPDDFKGFDLVLCDPPYSRGLGERALRALLSSEGIVADTAIVYLEAAKEDPVPGFLHWELVKERQKGVSRQLFYRRLKA